ncbi:MAG: glycosyltransferase family 4 protein [Bacillota bacterium]|uniref:glycosyltransferase family 4 protein n=1 Tax=Desulfurispora thermophila TaxID=265470 RepID=UPI00036182B9|nr:glycosyltransferase family 4 protein [Desulfurispora thermophila]
MGTVAFLSTYPPRECGLATFTCNLVKSFNRLNIQQRARVIAVSDSSYQYGTEVCLELEQHNPAGYPQTAARINALKPELLVIQHEYGIFGGESGEYLLSLLENLQIPLVTTVHTVLPNPSDKQRFILKQLGEKSSKVITMAANTIPLLTEVYEIPADKIAVIHHGVPVMAVEAREVLKEKHGLKDRQVVTTFGLLSPGKGIEHAISAIARVVKKHSDVIYLILGQTHPCVKRREGETYREKLLGLVAELGIAEHVRFVDKYLTEEEIINYLQMSDIYLTPYTGPNQAVSGTLAYAVGYGRVVISTPFSYAREMLAGGRGLLAEFNNPSSLADRINFVLEHPDKKAEMEQKTSQLGKTMTWPSVAGQYARLFRDILNHRYNREAMVV